MYSEPIEEVYFNWLYSKVAYMPNPTPSLTFYTLFRDLHSTEFVWLISGDDNRAQDGLDLRREFFRESLIHQDPVWNDIGCSVLEMLIAFSRKAEFETDLDARDWFWIFLDNLNLSEFSDARKNTSLRTSERLNTFIYREYERNGKGGMFPLKTPSGNQKKVQLWYQLAEYLIENDIF